MFFQRTQGLLALSKGTLKLWGGPQQMLSQFFSEKRKKKLKKEKIEEIETDKKEKIELFAPCRPIQWLHLLSVIGNILPIDERLFVERTDLRPYS